jgi:transcriptional regulator with XRE-family HTH domain
MEAFAARLKMLCESKFPGETQGQLAKRFGVSQPIISDYLKGKKMPASAKIVAMAEVLGCYTQFLFSGDAPTWRENPVNIDLSHLSPSAQQAVMSVIKSFEEIEQPPPRQ